jgi:uncharacterized protein YjiK
MRDLNFFKLRIAILLIIVTTAVSCRQRVRVLKSPPHYNFSQVRSEKLDPVKLREISGIAYDAKNDVFIGIGDEAGKVYMIDKGTFKLNAEYTFGENGDYEDVTIYKGTTYILKSDGTIIKFNKDSTGKASGTRAGQVGLPGTNDFESIYADTARKALIVICKNCSADNGKAISAFAFYPDSTGFDPRPVYTIDPVEVSKLSPFKASRFQPSAAAIHPIMRKLFILSSASSQLAIADLNGKVESVYKLSTKLFPQPEGIAFNKNGYMYISNEGPTGRPTLLTFSYSAGTDSAGKLSSDKNSSYDFTKPDTKMELGKHLHEISGMAWIPGRDIMLAENDEKGDIFTIDFKNNNDNIGKVKFGGKGDYEDIVYTDSAIYMLVSSGTIVQVETKDSTFNTKEFTLPGEKNEFETLYLDADKKSLIMLCKECKGEKKTEVRIAYRFDLTTQTFDPAPLYTIDIAEIQNMIGDNQALFKPSAAAVNPVDGKLYIVASVGKLLVVADKNTGKPEQAFKLDPVMYNQPEGMTIAPNGDIYISNEGGEGIATILKFVRKK